MSKAAGNPFRMDGIEVINFSLNPPIAMEESKETFEFSIELEQKTNADKKLIIVFTSIDIKDSESKNALANLRVACGFEITAFDLVIKRNKDGQYAIPHEISIIVNRVAIATTRGILFSQLRGSYLQKSILPLLHFEMS